LIRNDNYLTVVSIAYDPVYLEEPLVRTTDFEQAPRQFQTSYPCVPGDEIPRPFGEVPHYLPGANPYLKEHLARTNVPELAWEGGSETIYPEFRDKIAQGNLVRSTTPSPGASLNKVPGRVALPGVSIARVRDNIYAITGAGGNITASIGDDGVVLVDAGAPDKADQVLKALKTMTSQPVYWIINTTHEADHTGGNEMIAAAGTTYSPNGDAAGDPGARTLAHENLLTRMSTPTGVAPKFPLAAWPKDTYVGDQTALPRWFNGEGVRLVHPASAHTDDNTIVHFRKADVISTGDIYRTDMYPVIDLESGGSINGLIAAINDVLRMSVQDFMLDGGTLIVPGHGRIADASDLAYYRDMMTIIRDRVQDMVNKGMTLQQVKAARPTRDYDPAYGRTTGDWTTDRFIDAVYTSLKTTKGTR
jgi:glyoxylase-like metal-dependent hydrolase (beta-lactamase superfamily II)